MEAPVARVLQSSRLVEPTQLSTGNRLKGFDAAGKAVRMTASAASDFSSDGTTMTAHTRYTCPDGFPVKVVYIGTKSVIVEVPFKMENVPLP